MADSNILKQSTAATLKVGPFLDSTDGDTEMDALTIQKAHVRLSKEGGAFGAAHADQGVADAGAPYDEVGHYDVSVDATDTDTVGRLDLVIHKAGALIVCKSYFVVPAATYDAVTTGDPVASTIAAGGITESAFDADTAKYQAKVVLIDDEGGTTDLWLVTFFKNGQPYTGTVTSPTIQVIKASDGTDLLAATALTQIGSTKFYKKAEGTARITAGSGYIAVAAATLDGVAKTWSQPAGRDTA